MQSKLTDIINHIREGIVMNKGRYQEVFDLLAELEARLYYIKSDPGEMPIIEVAEIHDKIKDALVEWNHLGSYVEE